MLVDQVTDFDSVGVQLVLERSSATGVFFAANRYHWGGRFM